MRGNPPYAALLSARGLATKAGEPATATAASEPVGADLTLEP
jgi:hypothetical protein